MLTIGIMLTVREYSYSLSLIDNLFLVTFGALTVISYYDLNSKIFEIYKPSVE